MKYKILIFLAIALMAHTATALATPITDINAETAGVEDFWGVTDVEQGDKIAVKVDISLASNSPVPLNGYWIKITLRKPSNAIVEKWFDKTSDVISPGSGKSITCYTGVVADELGTWDVFAYLYDKDKQVQLDYDETQFTVVEKTPIVYITIKQIVGYATAAVILIGGWYGIRSWLL
jgi:hypothetical protein